MSIVTGTTLGTFRQELTVGNATKTTRGTFVPHRKTWPTSIGPKRLFELYSRTATGFTVRGRGGFEVCIAGTWTAVTAGTGGKTLDQAVTGITTAKWVAIKTVKGETGATVTLEILATTGTPLTGNDSTEFWPLHYLPVTASSTIDWANWVDYYQSSIHWLSE